MSNPWFRAPSKTKNGNRPFPAINPHCSVFASVLNFSPYVRHINAEGAPPSDFWRVYLPWQVGLVTWNHRNLNIEALLGFCSEALPTLLHNPAFRRFNKSHQLLHILRFP